MKTHLRTTAVCGHILQILHRLEDGILVGLLSSMIALAGLQILSRNLFDAGIVSSDIILRILVLWVGLTGAMVAARQDKHIRIDLLNKYLPMRARAIVDGLVKLFTSVVCAIATVYSIRFVASEFQDGGLAFSHVPVWICEAIIPLAFAVMAIRFFVLALNGCSTLVSKEGS